MTEDAQELMKRTNTEIAQVAEVVERPIPTRKLDFQDEITKLIPLAGTIELTEKQRGILYKVVDETDVLIGL